jgi:thymidylate synthase (FAD)
MTTTGLTWKKHHPLSDKNAFICLADNMGTDTTIAERARTSYNRDGKSFLQLRKQMWAKRLDLPILEYDVLNPGSEDIIITLDDGKRILYKETTEDRKFWTEIAPELSKAHKEDRNLLRRLMRDGHTSPFEMVEMVFLVQVPMDCWRQWIRHRTANVNEYSTRYTEALDFFQVTSPEEWRLQATDNKQGSSGLLTEWPEGNKVEIEYNSNQMTYDIIHRTNDTVRVFSMPYDWWDRMGYLQNPNAKYDEWGSYIGSNPEPTPGQVLTFLEKEYNTITNELYQLRIDLGIAKEQARKDLPLSTYTRAYWKCDLHNIFNFLRLRMDSHAQLEIRSFANSMFEIVKQICPVACEAFEDYVLHAKRFSRMEMNCIRAIVRAHDHQPMHWDKPTDFTDREWKEFLTKIS